MDIIEIIITIMAGSGAFLLGFKLLSDNMVRIAGNGLKVLFNKTSDKRFFNVGMGLATTAVIQSSAVTTVMVVGFVNSGIMTLYQAACIIMGANIGTTVTGQIAALQAFDIDLIFYFMLFVGVFMEMFGKKDKTKCVGLALAGLGLVFVGLDLMSGPMKGLADSPVVTDFLSSVNNPLLLLLIGLVLTAVIQSSSAVTTIIISMASAGLIIGGGGNSALFVVLGSNIGTCVTALISSIGTSVNARRASMIHLLFNVFGSLIFAIVLMIWTSFSAVTLEKWFSDPGTQIAMFHTIFNTVCTLLFVPFAGVLVKAATALVPEGKQPVKQETELMYMDKRFLETPTVAIDQLRKDSFHMADLAMENLKIAFNGFINRDMSVVEEVNKKNEDVAKLGERISDFLVQVSASGASLNNEKAVSALHNNVGDIARISELADNFTKYIRRAVNDDLTFSEGINEKLEEMHGLLYKQYDLVKQIIVEEKKELIPPSDELEEVIDTMRRDLVAEHIVRLGQGKCKPENNTIFINLVCNLERIGDHLSFVAHSRDN